MQGFLRTALVAADGAVGTVEGIDGVLLAVQGVLDTDVNITGRCLPIAHYVAVPSSRDLVIRIRLKPPCPPADIDARMACLEPWLDSLPNPTTLSNDIHGVQTALTGSVQPTLTDLSSQLAGVAPLVTAGGDYAQTLQSLASASSLLDSPQDDTGLVQQLGAFIAAANALPQAESTSAATAVKAALDALLNTGPGGAPMTFAAKVAAVNSAATAVGAGLQRIRTNPYVLPIQTDITSLQATAGSLLNVTLPALSQQLASVQAGYAAARPCIVALLARVQLINSSVVVLPKDMERMVGELETAQQTLDALMPTNSTGGLAALATQLDAAVAAGQLILSSLGTAGTSVANLSAAFAIIPHDTSAMSTAVAGMATTMQAAQPTLVQLQGDLSAYLLSAPSPAGYATVRLEAQGVAAAMAAALTALQNSILPVLDPVFSLVRGCCFAAYPLSRLPAHLPVSPAGDSCPCC